MTDAGDPSTTLPDGNIVLTGFMGTGKTSVGRSLAGRLGRRFVDTDESIAEAHGSIPEIFAARGEAGFRALERQLAEELSGRRGLIVSTGGGMLLVPETRAVLEASGRVFCLTAEPSTIVQRVRADGLATRPLLAGDDPAERIRALLAERAASYAAFESVVTDGREVDEIVDEIVRRGAFGPA